jgi:hypothetical protein
MVIYEQKVEKMRRRDEVQCLGREELQGMMGYRIRKGKGK